MCGPYTASFTTSGLVNNHRVDCMPRTISHIVGADMIELWLKTKKDLLSQQCIQTRFHLYNQIIIITLNVLNIVKKRKLVME